MVIVDKINDMSNIARNIQKSDKNIGFVPTMGYFHKGHTSLFKKSKECTDITIVSLFVNPTQFSPKEDFKTYPRDLDNDIRIAKEHNVDYLFVPTVQQMYPDNGTINIQMGTKQSVFEAVKRKGHFNGVVQILIKLFNIVMPNVVFMGQKDYQQTIVVKNLLNTFNYDIELVICPTVREENGLAMSSRNTYLSKEQIEEALILKRALDYTVDLVNKGERNKNTIEVLLKFFIRRNSNLVLDYASIVNAKDLLDIPRFTNEQAVVLLAGTVDNVRLIDNCLIDFSTI